MEYEDLITVGRFYSWNKRHHRSEMNISHYKEKD